MSSDAAPPPADPAYAAAVGLISAPLGRRALGFAFDALLVAIVTLPLTLGTIPALVAAYAAIRIGTTVPVLLRDGFPLRWALIWYAVGQGALIVLVLAQLAVHGLKGRTAGKAIVGIRSVSVRTWAAPGFWRVLLRALVLWAAMSIVPLLGAIPFLLSPLWDRQRRGRGWLDRIGGTWLLDVRAGLDPMDQKALRRARKAVDQPAPTPDAPLPSLSTASSGSFANYLPATRSSSGVVAGADAPSAWTPPSLGPAEAASAPEPTPSAPVDHPDATLGADVSATVAILVFDDGRRVPIFGPVVLGRNPVPAEGVEPLVVPDPSMMISKTHAELGVDATGPWVLDRHSANGTQVVGVDAAQLSLEPGVRRSVPWGSGLMLGGRRLRVEEPSGGPR